MAAELRDSRELAYTLFSRDMKASSGRVFSAMLGCFSLPLSPPSSG
jgi:hypothetical protein